MTDQLAPIQETSTATPLARSAGDRLTFVEINPVDGLGHFLKAVEGAPRQGRLKCDRGRLILVSPGLSHERAGVRLDFMLQEVFDVLDIPSLSCDSTLYRQVRLGRSDRGIEPDLSYYLQNEAKVRGLTNIDLQVSPPPDLVIEIVHHHGAKTAIGVCRKLRVPEIWVYDVPTRVLTLRTLVPSGAKSFRYQQTDRSRVLPFLRAEDVAPWCLLTDEADKDFKRRARAWAETVLLPRQQAGG